MAEANAAFKETRTGTRPGIFHQAHLRNGVFSPHLLVRVNILKIRLDFIPGLG